MSKEFIFKKDGDTIEFVGDFNGLYKSEQNPWEQSNDEDSILSKYYKSSRQTLYESIKDIKNIKNGCEVGCGLGYVTTSLNEIVKFDGIDISDVAVSKASKKFKNIEFFANDIGSNIFIHPKTYDVVVLNQILWYILKDMDNVVKNIDTILNKNGFLIISTLFLKNQKYGNEIIGSFDDLLRYWIETDKYRTIKANIDYGDDKEEYQDSILILQRKD
ncbi:class I SAM-dependent methyltransferase [Candidatus Sulfurimonas marisnigri]|uniref:Class I SAM-dependent methyltransferase n=1 Tax=Candidatus Sulfurimonas marisnigri TaxID=2740405 RepID=A0A7S7M0X4_9BACT|nr:class I SAM-dependent methyltransferase [Candidatus Sulfurimonas marisnigri]QOY54558.1 class I SAM-dependent methyltransferase [Candidatus Sulfurimonas marisnigri]